MCHHLGRRAFSNDMATMHARAGADIYHVVRQADSVFIMLDHDHGIADIAQVFQRAQQAVVIPLVQANRGFVEDIQHAHEAGADLAGQANALCLTARQGIGTAVQRQIVQAHVDQELQSLANLLEDLVGNLSTTTGQLQHAKVFTGIADRQVGYCRQGLLAHPYMPGFTAQARATAIRAWLCAEELRQLLAHARRFGFAVTAFQVRHDAFERVRALDDIAAIVQVFEVDILRTAAI